MEVGTSGAYGAGSKSPESCGTGTWGRGERARTRVGGEAFMSQLRPRNLLFDLDCLILL